MSDNSSKKGNWFKRHKIWTVVIALVIIGIIGASTNGNNNQNTSSGNSTDTSTKTTTTNSSSTAQSTSSSTPGLNQQANDGKFGFTVTSFQCGVTEIDQPGDTDGIDSTAQGAPYCEMNVSVKGISTVSQDFNDDAQYVYDTSNKQYSVDDDATIDANNANNNCMELPTVNPGVTITCTLVFDVPASAHISYAMLHDSEASDGVKVNL